MSGRMGQYLREARTLMREAASVGDFLTLMRVRLALSKVGRLTSPTPHVSTASTKQLGKGLVLRSHATDIAVLLELFSSNSYEPVPRLLPAPPRTIVDLGANIGLVSRWLLEKYPDSRLVAVEPEPGNFRVLVKNLAPYGDRAKTIQACVAATRRTVRLAGGRGDWGFSMTENGEGVDVPAITMNDVLDRAGMDGVDLLKCDIEGAEGEVFDACSGWIDRIAYTVIECHEGITGETIAAAAARGGVAQRILERDRNLEYGFETVVMCPAGQ